MDGKELESINVTITYYKKASKHKETLIAYGNKGDEKTSSESEKKEK